MERKKYLEKEIDFQETPHSGYHWHGDEDRFFEGWYFRVSLPEIRENFAFMYSIDDPMGGKRHSGGAVQIIGIKEEYLWRTFPDVNKFWAGRNSLALTHWGKTNLKIKPQILENSEFEQHIKEGYQVTTTLNQGFIQNPSNNKYCRWQYKTTPIYGWGNREGNQKSTAGLFSFLPIFEPGWQILMALGLATGYIDWNGKIYQFKNAPAYSEKNWGCSFPEKWFWINCNSFNNELDLTLTAAGGKRKVLWWSEEVGMIGIHFQDKFYQFSTGNCQVNWQIEPWGKWQMQADNDGLKLKLIGTTNLPSTSVRVPTEKGLKFACQDTLKGQLELQLTDGNGEIIISCDSDMCGLEIGGSGWQQPWLS
jgi:tocopherol cyclase